MGEKNRFYLDSGHWSTNRPDGRPTRWVVLHYELLQLNATLLSQHLQNRGWNHISCVSLTVVDLQNYTTVHGRSMILLVLLGVVRVNGVRHISWDLETSQVKLLDRISLDTFLGEILRQDLEDSVDCAFNESWISSLEALRANFFVVVQSYHVDETAIRVVTLRVNQTSQGEVGWVQVIQSRWRDKFLVETEKA